MDRNLQYFDMLNLSFVAQFFSAFHTVEGCYADVSLISSN